MGLKIYPFKTKLAPLDLLDEALSSFCRMTAVCPSESTPEGAEAGAGGADAARDSSVSAGDSGESSRDPLGGSVGGTVLSTSSQRYSRWSRQDSSDINTDDEGATVRRLTPLERLNLDMCQDDR